MVAISEMPKIMTTIISTLCRWNATCDSHGMASSATTVVNSPADGRGDEGDRQRLLPPFPCRVIG